MFQILQSAILNSTIQMSKCQILNRDQGPEKPLINRLDLILFTVEIRLYNPPSWIGQFQNSNMTLGVMHK